MQKNGLQAQVPGKRAISNARLICVSIVYALTHLALALPDFVAIIILLLPKI